MTVLLAWDDRSIKADNKSVLSQEKILLDHENDKDLNKENNSVLDHSL